MYVLENATFLLSIPVDAEPDFSAEDLNWSEQNPGTSTGLDRWILGKNKASWNLVLVERIRVSIGEFSVYLPITYPGPTGFRGFVLGWKVKFLSLWPISLYLKSVQLLLASTLLLLWFEPCKGMAALATIAPLVARATFSLWLPVYLTGCSMVHSQCFRKAKKRGRGKVSGERCQPAVELGGFCGLTLLSASQAGSWESVNSICAVVWPEKLPQKLFPMQPSLCAGQVTIGTDTQTPENLVL